MTGWNVCVFAALVSVVAFSQHAVAQNAQTWVSGSGDDGGDCALATPCATVAGAYQKTNADGLITILDPGASTGFVIGKSIRIEGGGIGGAVTNPRFLVGFNVSGNNIDVVLSNLTIDGFGGSAGVYFERGRSLVLDNVTIRDQTVAFGSGILIANTSGTAKITIRNSLISNNGEGTVGAGIQIVPTGSGSVDLTVQNSTVSNNVVGIRADTKSTTGSVDLAVTDTVVSDNTYHGVVALGSGGRASAGVFNSMVASNLGEGLRAVGANARISVGHSVVTGNGTGIFSSSGGKVQSFGDNRISSNVVDGVFSTPLLQTK